MIDINLEPEIINLYKEGLSGKKIQDQTGVSATQVRRILKKNNIQARSNKTEDTIEKDIIEKYNQGLSSEKIAKELDLNPSTVCRILKRNSIDIKGASHFNSKYTINEDFLDNINTEEKAYFLGFMFADGAVHKSENSFKLEVHEQDQDILIKFQNLLFVGENSKIGTDREIYKYFSINSNNLVEKLIENGCGPKKTFNITFPNLPENLIPHFLRGLFDGDGCIYFPYDSNRVIIQLTGYLPFMHEVREYIQKHNINGYSHNVKHKELVGEFIITKQQEVHKMLDYLYKDATIYLDRKYKKYLRAKENFSAKV
jgi:intein-encoded DNA endonuclease-like protein